MNWNSRARRLARLLGTACAILSTPALAQEAAPAPDGEAIVVTGMREHGPDNPLHTEESVGADRLSETTAVVDTEDSLRYLPSLLVRKRHIGDTQAPLATRTSGVGSSARSLVYADGVLLSALIGNNNSTASPRWGMVAPEEIARVDVLYGPFSAAYPGNSIGAVVNITTRLPDKPEASATVATSVQRFSQYATDGIFPAYQAAATLGSKVGPLALFISANHVSSRSQPLAYVATARPAATGTSGEPVTGAFSGLSRTGQPIYVVGAAGFEDQQQDNLKLKASLSLSPALRLTYQGGLFLNDTHAHAQTYLSDHSYAGTVNVDGRTVSIPASAFSNNVYRLNERHWMHALTAEGGAAGFDWRLAGSLYDFDKDRQRIPSGALPGARSGGAGSIVSLDGTGWRTLDLSADRKGSSLGAHWDQVRLVSDRYQTPDWLRGGTGALVQAARGRTSTSALWGQQILMLMPHLHLILGARFEWWKADRGFNFSVAPALSVRPPELERSGLSPKASLHWLPLDHWSIILSAAQAYRFPTVQELYQAISTGPTITIPDPNLRPERARSAELAIERSDTNGHVRLSLFGEWIRDALISQSAPLVSGSSTLFNYVQNIPADRTFGAELSFVRERVFFPQLEVEGSFTLADPKIARDPVLPAAQGKDIPQVPRRRGDLILTWHEGETTAFTLAARYASRSFATIDNSDAISHTFQGFDGYFVVDARASFRIGERWRLAFGVENIGNDRYFIFHPFPQRTFTAEAHVQW